MKKAEKLSILISIVLISLLAISAVSAADADDAIGAVSTDDAPAVADAQDTTTITEESSSPEPVKEAETKPVAAPEKGNFSDLKNKLDAYYADGTNKFELDRDYEFDQYSDVDWKDGITLAPGDKDDGTRTITIDGKGFSISGKNKATSIFVVDNGMKLILENLELIKTTEAAVNVVNATSSLTTEQVTFKQNKGAAIANVGTLFIEDTKFYDNDVAIDTFGPSTAGDVDLENLALFDVTILNSYFEGNNESIDTDNNTVYIENTEFYMNGGWDDTTGFIGAAINAYESALCIVDTEFENNDASIFLAQSGLSLENVLITGDQSEGAIFAYDSAIGMYNATFGGNVGGAIQATASDIFIEASNFIANNGYDDDVYADAAIVGYSSDITVIDSLFKENYGAIDLIYGGNLTVDNTTFKKNYAGAIFADGATDGVDEDDNPILYIARVNISNSTFTKNTVYDEDGKWSTIASSGGAIFIGELAELTVKDSLFDRNVGCDGGAIYIDDGFDEEVADYFVGVAYIINSTFTDNIAYYNVSNEFLFLGDGGAIYNNGNLTVVDGTFTGNLATDGGAIYNTGDATITGYFEENEAWDYDGDEEYGGYGGAIANFFGEVRIGGIFIDNYADTSGGAIYNLGEAEIEGDFEENTAKYGGAIANDDEAEIEGDFEGNTAKENGGAIYNAGDAEIEGDFEGNTAYFGGAIYNDKNAEAEIAGNFEENTAVAGGAIANFKGNVSIMLSAFEGNSAIEDEEEGAPTTFNGVGGAIATNSGKVTIDDSRFTNDYADIDGSEIYTNNNDDENPNVFVTDTVITNNLDLDADTLAKAGIDLDETVEQYNAIVDFESMVLNTVEDKVVIFFTLYDVKDILELNPIYGEIELGGDIDDNEAVTFYPFFTDELEGDIGGVNYTILATLLDQKDGDYRYEGYTIEVPINVTLTVENLEELLEIDEAYEDYLNEKIDNLTDENYNLTKELNTTEKELNKTEKELNTTKQELNTTKEDLKTTTEELTVAIEGLYLANSELNATKGKLNTTEAQLKQANDDLTKEIQQNTDLSAALANKNTEAANLQAQVATLQTQNKQLNSDVKAANDKAATANNNANAKIKKVKAASKVKKSKNFTITVNLNKKVKGKYVFVAFNGKTYKKKTNSKGVAKITIKKSALKKLGGKKVKYQIISGNSMKNKSVKIKK